MTGDGQRAADGALPDGPTARPLSALLLAGILLMPGIFGWFLARRGYSRSLRLGTFCYAVLVIGAGLASRR